MAFFLLVLLLLNTYPIWILRDFVAAQKRASMSAQAEIMTRVLRDFDSLTRENVSRVIGLLDDGSYRVLCCDADGLLVYDNAPGGNAAGRRVLLGEMRDALAGQDVYRGAYADGAFDSALAMPVISRGMVLGALYLNEVDTAQAAMLSSLRANLMTASVAAFSAVMMFGLFASAALTRRLTDILRAIRSVRDGQYTYQARERGKDELSELATYMNELTAILEKTESLRQQFVSNASHELKTPLASVRLLTDSILGAPDMPIGQIREFVTDIGEETERLSRMTEKLMALSRLESAPQARRKRVEPAPVARRAARTLAPVAQRAGVELRCELAENAPIAGSEDELHQIVFNLMDNAVKYNKPGGEVRVFVFARAKEVQIIVTDTGTGIPEDDLPRIFDRFYRVDKARSREAGGAGLGLSIVQEAAARMGGTVRAESVPGEGSRFILTFSRWENAHEEA